MTWRWRRGGTATGLLAALAGTLLACGADVDEPVATVSDPSPTSVIASGSAVAISVSGPGNPRLMTLTCDPPCGSHPDPGSACSALESWMVRADSAESSSSPGTTCPLPRGPEPVLTIKGTWRGESLNVRVSKADCSGDWGALLAVISPPNAM